MAKNKPHTYAKKENGKNNVGAKEKYTAEFVTNELKEMLDYINSDEGSDVVFIGELCLYRGYSPQRWSEISLKHKENEEITETIKIIEAKLEYRLYKAGLTNQVNSTVCLAGLNNKYRWENAKSKIDHSSSDGTMTPKIIVDPFKQIRENACIDDSDRKAEVSS